MRYPNEEPFPWFTLVGLCSFLSVVSFHWVKYSVTGGKWYEWFSKVWDNLVFLPMWQQVVLFSLAMLVLWGLLPEGDDDDDDYREY